MTNCLISSGHWLLYRVSPGATCEPGALADLTPVKQNFAPSSVMSLLTDEYSDVHHPPFNCDDFDWWYLCRFTDNDHPGPRYLELDGLASLADVWLNNKLILQSDNMFVSHVVDVREELSETNRLAIRFRSVTADLKNKRPRPRWKTNLVTNQQLRWLRTSLIGRIPGWTPPVPTVGPWRPMRLETKEAVVIEKALSTKLDSHSGFVDVDLMVVIDAAVPDDLAASLTIDKQQSPLNATYENGRLHITGKIELSKVDAWYPHTHGVPALYEYELSLSDGKTTTQIDNGRLGFRTVDIDTDDERTQISLNGREVFCRGACWTTSDILNLNETEESCRRALTLLRDSGANMLRISGPMVYESDEFYAVCDELGILVWQDFMFANMDYPSDDGAFLESVETEVSQTVNRLGQHPAVVVFCGNSEVEQQAAMVGVPEDIRENSLFHKVIPQRILESDADFAYFPSSPGGGALPFHVGTGISHYFGVGAYKRRLDDARIAGVRFASECLGISNIPSNNALLEHFGSNAPPVHTPIWKLGVPRDSAAGWDFEDIRDHYLFDLYGIDAAELRYADRDRYVELSKSVSGEVIERVFREWRSRSNPCRGGLVWTLNDLVPGAGWGLIDSDGNAKPLYYFLRRSWASTSISLLDRGLDGLAIEITNESTEPFSGYAKFFLIKNGSVRTAEASREVAVSSSSNLSLSLDEILGAFHDTTFAYRFGPLRNTVVCAVLADEGGQVIASDAVFPGGHLLTLLESPTVEIQASEEENLVRIHLRSDSFLKNIELSARDFEFSDNFFHVIPDQGYEIHAMPLPGTSRKFRGTFKAQNCESVLRIR